MSRYLSKKYDDLVPYVPGEQPKDQKYIKLNTNESPYETSALAQKKISEVSKNLRLYSDPDCTPLVKTGAEYFGVEKNELLFFNGSDEILNYIVMAYCDDEHELVFPDITYGFYQVIAELNKVKYSTIPLDENFRMNPEEYRGINKTIMFPNPNAPTGIALSVKDVERIVASNPNNVVVVDEAYVDFGAESSIKLTRNYNNLLVVSTFSKSRSLAGGRLGFVIGHKDLISDLNSLKYSNNPYTVNTLTMYAGIGALEDDAYIKENCRKIMRTREITSSALTKMGFKVLDSKANFIFVSHPGISGEDLYLKLREKGILVRYFDKDRLRDFIRITIGTSEQMHILIEKIDEILGE